MAERHHFYLQDHCTTAMYPQSMPNIQLPSREASFYWRLYTGNGRLGGLYEANLSRALLRTLQRAKKSSRNLKNIVLSPELIKVKHLDLIERKRVIEEIKEYLSCQKNLKNVTMENLRLRRMEAISLVRALENSGKTVECLQCWGAFGRAEGPLLVDTGNFNGSGLYKDRVIRRNEWLEALGCLQALTTLSLNYAYIATEDGDFLIDLANKIGDHWKWLQLLCLESETPIIKHAYDGVGGHRIPDFAWKKAVELAPHLKVQFVFVDVHGYDNQMKFLSKSIPVQTMIISTSFEVVPVEPAMIDCTVKTLWVWYPESLEHLSLHFWHNREFLDCLLKKLLLNLPKLKVFEFTGEIRKLQTLHDICTQIQNQKHNLEHINLHLQKPINEKKDETTWKNEIIAAISHFQEEFSKMSIKFLLDFYK